MVYVTGSPIAAFDNTRGRWAASQAGDGGGGGQTKGSHLGTHGSVTPSGRGVGVPLMAVCTVALQIWMLRGIVLLSASPPIAYTGIGAGGVPPVAVVESATALRRVDREFSRRDT